MRGVGGLFHIVGILSQLCRERILQWIERCGGAWLSLQCLTEFHWRMIAETHPKRIVCQMYASLAWMLFCEVFLIIYYSLLSEDLAKGDGNNSTNFQKNITEKKHMLKPCDVNLTKENVFIILKIKHCIYWHSQNLLGHRSLYITMFPQVLSTKHLPQYLPQ